MTAFSQLEEKWDGETKIPQMNMAQLKPFLCPLSGHDPYKCIGCKQIQTCIAGQRAVELMDQETMRKNDIAPKNRSDAVIKSMHLARQAAASNDPVGWIMENTGCNYKAARQKLLNWKKKFPDIMQKVKMSTKEETMSELWEQRANLKTAIMSGDPYEWYRKHSKMQRSRVEKIIENGMKKDPEVKELMAKYVNGQPEEDEVTIEEFLNEFAEDPVEQPETAPEAIPEIAPEEIPVEQEKPVEAEKKAVFKGTVIGIELNQKYAELHAERAELMARMKMLDEQIDALDTVRKMFGVAE